MFGLSPLGALKLLSRDAMERNKGRNGILSNLGSFFLSADMMPLTGRALARLFVCASVCNHTTKTKIAQNVLIDCSTFSRIAGVFEGAVLFLNHGHGLLLVTQRK